jgi:hypothetical protein
MKPNYKKVSALIKKLFIKLCNRKWMFNYTFYTNTCFVFSFENKFQKKKCEQIKNFLANIGYEVREFHNCFQANLPCYQNPLYNSMVQLWAKRVLDWN